MADLGPDAGATHGVTVGCGQCGAAVEIAGARALACAYCGSPQVVDRPASPGRPRPALVLAFAVDAARARAALVQWRGRWARWTARGLRTAHAEQLRAVYVPAYLYSAVAETVYDAMIGEQYFTTEERVVRGPRPVVPDLPGVPAPPPISYTTTETRRVTRTEHLPLAGRHLGYVTDVLISASRGLTHDELAALGPFDWRAARPYAPAVVAGWDAEESARTVDDCTRAGRAAALDEVGGWLRRHLPGDSHSDLTWKTHLTWESLDPVLVPVWVLAVRYHPGRPALRVLVNGQTGAVVGARPLAWGRVIAAVAVVAAVAVALAVALGGRG